MHSRKKHQSKKNGDTVDQKLFDAVWQELHGQLPFVSGFGVRAIGLCGRLIKGVPGLECMLFAEDMLAEQVLSGPERAYSDQLLPMYRKIHQNMQAHEGVAFCRSEPLVVALNENAARQAGMQPQDDYQYVPATNFPYVVQSDYDTDEEILDRLDPWGHLLTEGSFFDPDYVDPAHQMWVSLSLLPWEQSAATISDQLYRRSVLVTQLGWGMFAKGEHDPGLIRHATSLKEAAMAAEAHPGWITW